LVDAPFAAVGAGNVDVGVDQGNSVEVSGPLDRRPVSDISYEISIIVSETRL
jgi:hypothetical protein